MRLSEIAISLLILQVSGPRREVAEAAFSSPTVTGTIATDINRAVSDPIAQPLPRRSARKPSPLPLRNSLDDIEGFRRSPEDLEKDSGGPRRNNVEQTSEVLASAEAAPVESNESRLAKDVESTASAVQSKQEQLDRLKAQRDEILQEYAGPVAAAWLTPLAALGAGRAYLQRRQSVQTEIEAAKAELDAKRAELERKQAQLGRVPRSNEQKEEQGLRVSRCIRSMEFLPCSMVVIVSFGLKLSVFFSYAKVQCDRL